MKTKIMQEYQANKQDADFLATKLEYQQLHNKLAHIKRLVTQFDQTHPPLPAADDDCNGDDDCHGHDAALP